MSCPDICTAAKCAELEQRISALEQALELLEASFEAHTNQDIPQAHNYQPKVEVSLAANSSDNSLKVFVKVDESSDDETITLPDAKVEVSLAANSSDNSLKVFVKVGNQSDDETVTLPKQEWDIDLYIPIILARLKAELTAEFDLELEAHAALDFSQAHNYLESKSNLAIDGSFQSNNLYLTVADGQSQDTATISIYIPDAIDGKDGERGLRGFAGTDGIDGIDGVDGIDGRDGIDGQDGIDGVDGVDGIDGIDGVDGIDGIDGVDGIDGEDGRDGGGGISSDGCAIDLIYENNLLTANLTVGQCFSSDNTKIMEFSPIDVEQITCVDGVAESTIVSVAVIKGTEAAELEAYAARASIQKLQCESTNEVVSIVASDKVINRASGKFLVLHFVTLDNYPKRKRNSTYYPVQIPAARESYDWNIDFKDLSWRRGNCYAELRFLEFKNSVSGFFANKEAADLYFDAVLNLTIATEFNRVYSEHKTPQRQIIQQVTRPYRAFIEQVNSDGRAECLIKYMPLFEPNNE